MLMSLMLSSVLGAGVDEVRPPKVGEPFPDLMFPLLGEEGELSSLSDFADIKVLLIQFASW